MTDAPGPRPNATPGEVLLERKGGPVLRLWETPRGSIEPVTLWPASANHTLTLAMRTQARRFHVRFAGRRIIVETTGDGYSLMPAGADAAFDGPSGKYTYAMLAMPRGWLADLCLQHGLGAADRELPPRLGANKAPEMKALAQLLREAHTSGAASPGFLDHWVMLAGIASLRDSGCAGGVPRASPGLPAGRLRRVLDYIRAMLEEEITLQDLAAVAGLSPWHFARAFRAEMGMPPHSYVTCCRLDRARGFLREGQHSLAEVAAACGFASQTHFTTAFRRAFGVPPGQWRVARHG